MNLEQSLLDGHHLKRMAVFGLLYAVSAIVVMRWPGWLMAPSYLLAAASLHGLSLFTHEAVHGTLSRRPRWNAALGALCAWPVLQNYSAYRVLHLKHHAHLGHEGDPDHYPNYTRWSWLVFWMNWGRLLIGYPVYIVAIPILGWRQGTGRDRVGITVEAIGCLAVLGLLAFLPWRFTLQAWLIPMLIVNTMVNIRGMSQHTLLEEFHEDEVRGTRSILTHPVVAFFMCNENYHLEHHLRPGVPWYQLPRLHAEMQAELRRRGAPYIKSYGSFVYAFVIGSFRRSPWGAKP